MKNFFRTFLFVVSVLTFGLFFNSCLDGLGGAVDTQAPKLSFDADSTKTGAVKSGDIVLKGVATDDTNVKEVLINIENLSDESDVVTYVANLNRDGDSLKWYWNYTIDGTTFKDGKYRISVNALDASHTTEKTLNIDIDNTPPVFWFTELGATGEQTPTTQGTFLKIEGNAYDAHKIKDMILHIYYKDGTETKEIDFDNDTSDGVITPLIISKDDHGTKIELTAANLKKAGELKNRYDTIYNITGDNPHNYYLALQLKDEAGNISSKSYIANDVIKVMLNDNAIEDFSFSALTDLIYKKKLPDAEDYIDKNYNTLCTTLSDNTVGYVYEENSTIKIDKLLKFALDKEINPTYKVEDYEIKNSNFNSLSSSRTELSIYLEYGKNKHAVKSELEVDIYKEEGYDPETSTPYLKILNDKYYVNGTEKSANLIKDRTSGSVINKNDSAFKDKTIKVSIPELTFTDDSKKFYVQVVGSDILLNPLEPNEKNTYGFIYSVNQNPSKIKSINCKVNGIDINDIDKDYLNYEKLQNLVVYGEVENESSFEYSEWIAECTINNVAKTWKGDITHNLKTGESKIHEWSFDSLLNTSKVTSGKTDLENVITSLESGIDLVITLTLNIKNHTGDPKTLTLNIDTKKPVLNELNIGSKTYVGTSVVNGNDIWFKDTSLNFNGLYSEYTEFSGNNIKSGSGIEGVYYIIKSDNTTPTESELKASSSFNVSSSYKKNDSDVNKRNKTSFNTNLSGFNSGTNYISLMAVDYAGNCSEIKGPYIVKIDNEVPDVTIDLINGSTIVKNNGKKDVTLTGTWIDTVSGIKSLKVTNNSYTVNATVNNDNTWTAILEKNKYDNGSIILDVEDNAGNTKTVITKTNINVDNIVPTVRVSSPSPLDVVNKTIYVEGNVFDTNGIKKITVKASYNGQVVTKVIPGTYDNVTYTIPSDGQFAIPFDTTEFYNNDASVDLTIKVFAEDNVENVSEPSTTNGTEFTVTIDQKSDKPVIDIGNLTNNNGNYVLMYGTNAQITGTITEDDKTSEKYVAKFLVADKKITSVTKVDASNYTINVGGEDVNYTYEESAGKQIWKGPLSAGKQSIVTYTLKTGNWIYQPQDISDGSHDVYFYIEDNKGSIFYTGSGNILTNPYIQFKSDNKVDNSTVIKYNSDGASPSVTAFEGTIYNKDDVASAKTSIDSSFIIGGEKNTKAVLEFSASDSNGIVGMACEIYKGSGNSKTTVVKYATATTLGTADYSSYTIYNTGFTPTTDETTCVWKLPKIDFSSIGTGEYTIDVKAYDSSALYGSGSVKFYIDNSAPELRGSIRPLNTSISSGNIEITGTTSSVGIAEIKYTKWAIPTKTQVSTAAATSDADAWFRENLTWHNENNDGDDLSWRFVFKESTNTPGEIIYPLTEYDTSVYCAPNVNGVYSIPIYFLFEDDLGNYVIISDYKLRHNPDADKPEMTFTYPTTADYDSGHDYATVGGTIRVNGISSIGGTDASVIGAFIQIGTPKADGTITWNKNASFLSSYTKKVYTNAYNGGTITSGWITEMVDKNNPTPAEATALQAEKDAWWGIPTDFTNPRWYISINTNGELNNETPTKYYIRACGINENGKIGNWSDAIQINVDKNVPRIAVSINKYSSLSGVSAGTVTSSSLTPTTSQNYISNMYLKDQWYLTALVTDDSGISDYSVSYKIGNNTTNITKESIVKEQYSNSGRSGYYLYIPIIDSSSSISYTITASDSTGASVNSVYDFNIDNTAPTISNITGNGNALSSDSTRYNIEESEYVFTLKGKTEDAGSGFSKQVFYFMRDTDDVLNSSKTCVFDPIKPSAGAYEDRILLSNLTKLTITQGASSYNMYGKEVLGDITGIKEFTPTTSTNITNNKHIRKGSLVYIGGMYRTVTDISNTGVVSFLPAVDENVVTTTSAADITATFVYAQVIDKQGEKTDDNSLNPFNIEGDDGDGLVENYTQSGTSTTWSGTIHCSNIPDGPATLVILAFDDAGNVSCEKRKVMVSNNAPRIAKVFFGTDLDGDNVFSKEEYCEYSMFGVTGKEQSSYTIDFTEKTQSGADKWVNGKFTIKDKLSVIAEFVGGNIEENGDLKLVYKNNATSVAPVTGSGSALRSSVSIAKSNASKKATFTSTTANGLTVDAGTLDAALAETSMYSYLISSSDVGSDGTNKGMSFTFWDQTEERTQGTNSQNAVIYVKNFDVDQVDDVKPVVAITGIDIVDHSTGHIDVSGTWNSNGDDAVSGVITISGTAQDETRLKTLTMYITQYKMGNTSSGTQTISTTAQTTVQTVATYSAGSWTSNIDGFEVTPVSMNQEGHKVSWKYTFDSSKIVNYAQNNVVITVSATDSRNSAVAKTKQVDVVPYITDISNGYMDADSGTNIYLKRSASGAYMTSKNDSDKPNLTVKGFNLKGGKVYLGTTQLTTSADEDSLTISKANLTKSGYIKVINNSIESNNNKNDNTVTSNVEADTYGPYRTDDRYLYVWDSTTTTYNGTYAVMKPEINSSGNKTGNMEWMYLYNGCSIYLGGQHISWCWSQDGGDFTYNASGMPMYIFMCANNWNGTKPWEYNGSVNWGMDKRESYGSYNWNISGSTLGVGNISFNSNTNGYSYTEQSLHRFEKLKIITTGDNTNTTNFVAYFDKMNESRSIVFFRYNVGTNINNKNTDMYTNFNNENLYESWNSDLDKKVNYKKWYDTNTSTATGVDTPRGREEVTTNSADSSNFDMKYDSVNDTIYIAYYDEGSGGLKIAYLNDATNFNRTEDSVTLNGITWSPSDMHNTGWTVAKTINGVNNNSIDPDAAGMYVAMEIDDKGRIHLAYYDSTKSYLKYALVEPTLESNNVTQLTVSKKVIVDALFTNGYCNSITLKQFGTNDVRPVITSYSISYAGKKFALRTSWPTTTVENIESGVTSSSGYTGKWETVTVCSQVVPIQDNTFTETTGDNYTGNIVVGYNSSTYMEQTKLLSE